MTNGGATGEEKKIVEVGGRAYLTVILLLLGFVTLLLSISGVTIPLPYQIPLNILGYFLMLLSIAVLVRGKGKITISIILTILAVFMPLFFPTYGYLLLALSVIFVCSLVYLASSTYLESSCALKITAFTLFIISIVIALFLLLGNLGILVGMVSSLLFISMFIPISGIPTEKLKAISSILPVVSSVLISVSVAQAFLIVGYLYSIIFAIVVGFSYYSLSYFFCLERKKEGGKTVTTGKIIWGRFAFLNIATLIIGVILIVYNVGTGLQAGVAFSFPTLQFQLVSGAQKYWEFTNLLMNPDYQEFQSLVGAEYEEEEITTGAPITKTFDIYQFLVSPEEGKEDITRYLTLGIENYMSDDIDVSFYVITSSKEEKTMNYPDTSWSISACPYGEFTDMDCPTSPGTVTKTIPKGGKDVFQCSFKLKIKDDAKSQGVNKVSCVLESIISSKFNTTALYKLKFMSEGYYLTVVTQGNIKSYEEVPRATVSRGVLEIRMDTKETQPIVLGSEERIIDLHVAFAKVGSGTIGKEGFFSKIPAIALFVPKTLVESVDKLSGDFSCYEGISATGELSDLQAAKSIESYYSKISDDYYLCLLSNVTEFKTYHLIIKTKGDIVFKNGKRDIATYYIVAFAPDYEYSIAKDAKIVSEAK